MRQIIVINGSGGSGKDTFVEFVRECYTADKSIVVSCVSSVEAVKEAAKVLGWDGNKDTKGRGFLAHLKDVSSLAYDGPFNYVANRCSKILQANQGKNNIIFIMCREPNEIDRLIKYYSPCSISLLIKRPGIPKHGNHADDDVDNYNYDYTINNSGSLEDFKETARDFIRDRIFHIPDEAA